MKTWWVIAIIAISILLLIVLTFLILKYIVHKQIKSYAQLAKEHVNITSRAIENLKDNNMVNFMNSISQYVDNSKQWFPKSREDSSQWVQLMKEHLQGVKDLGTAIINNDINAQGPAILNLGQNQEKVVSFLQSRIKQNIKPELNRMWTDHLKCTVSYMKEIAANGKSDIYNNLVNSCANMAENMGAMLDKYALGKWSMSYRELLQEN